ncbi:DUF317 domain-containing protein [Streptomyces sp. NPDC057702]|uniref:DUF317 domain-containing protein n=1 Tax=unclassified Streptomyces TaxID=2593676 RepID=UPI0036CE11DC
MKNAKRQGWGPGEQAEQHYLIQPRALAGGGDMRHVSEFLRASGWRDKARAGGGLLLMESPDRTVRVGYDPSSPPGGWTLHGRTQGPGGQWWAHLGQQTPVEIVAGLTDALTRPRPAHAPNVWAPLEGQGWRTRFVGEHYTATSADGTAWVQYHRGGNGGAMWWAGAKDQQGNGWTAHLSPHTPLHVVQAFAAALAHPEPLMRPRDRVPRSAHIRTWSVSVTPSQLSAWRQARITAARAATWARNSARHARPRTTARPHVPRSGLRTHR